MIANAANLAALIYHGLPDLNWAGFYFTRGSDLVRRPLQGKIMRRAGQSTPYAWEATSRASS
jgi:putative methionine-R-sulfoxide reductase with GAF domain